jgi:putative PIN family toxin of toxin-antitoxin system
LIVVLDTNVWSSALAYSRPGSTPVRALHKAVTEDVIAISNDLIAEIHRVLVERCSWSEQQATLELDDRLGAALNVELTHTTRVCRDPKDDMFLECAAIAGADLIVAGDKDLLTLGFHAGTRIVTPAEYVDLPL